VFEGFAGGGEGRGVGKANHNRRCRLTTSPFRLPAI
jgi:hypothetical protein